MFWKRVGRWAILAIAVPMVAKVLRRVGESVEERRGPGRVSGLMRKSAAGLDVVSGRRPRR